MSAEEILEALFAASDANNAISFHIPSWQKRRLLRCKLQELRAIIVQTIPLSASLLRQVRVGFGFGGVQQISNLCSLHEVHSAVI